LLFRLTMAQALLCGLQDEFTCSLCLETPTDSVSLHCGHRFCLDCLMDCWEKSQVCRCPQCRHIFTTKPEFYRKIVLSVLKKFNETRLSSPPFQKYAGPENVVCGACTGEKCRARRSCVTCVACYHQIHFHFKIAALMHKNVVHRIGAKKKKLLSHDWQFLLGDSIQCFSLIDKENLKRFTDLIQCFEEAHETPAERIREQEKEQIEKAEGVIEQLERETEELKKKDAELMELSDTKDHVHFMQVRATLHSPIPHSQMSSLVFFSLLSDFCPLILEINTAQCVLCLSEGNKKVTRERKVTIYPDHPDRFDGWQQVLCREALTETRYYWEVECTGHFMMIGVAYKGLSRKGKGRECIIGYNDKSWSLQWSHSQYFVCHNNMRTVISAPYSPRIGVYLDWPAGSLLFYSISHTMTLMHRFNTSFTEPLYPGLISCWGRGHLTLQLELRPQEYLRRSCR
uniref:Uncharacterized protein n=1 Tax=Erpetoichthys calabaricus TaxID=27687 RepID=A0A8C4SUH3_ERPCA